MEALQVQLLLNTLDSIKRLETVAEVQKQIQRVVDQFGAIWNADKLTLYIRNPWSELYELRHHSGVQQREFLWDRPDAANALNQILALSKDAHGSRYYFIEDATVSDKLGWNNPRSFVYREGIKSVGVVYAFGREDALDKECNAILFVNWNATTPDPWKNQGVWVRLFSQSLHDAVQTLLYHSVPDIELLGRHLALAEKLNRTIPELIKSGTQHIAELLAEMAGNQTACTIYRVERTEEPLVLFAVASTRGSFRDGTVAVAPDVNDSPRKRIRVAAVELNKMIYVDNFQDQDWLDRYEPPPGDVLSELAIPILGERGAGKQVKFVVSLYRPHANAFSYEEIRLLQGSVAQIRANLAPPIDFDVVKRDEDVAKIVNSPSFEAAKRAARKRRTPPPS